MKKSKLDSNNYIYDLNNTMKINLDMIENILPSILSDKVNEKNKLEEQLKRIKQLFEKKLNLKKSKNENKSKILVQNQILEETRRRKEENLNYFEEKFDELCNGLDKKFIFIKNIKKNSMKFKYIFKGNVNIFLDGKNYLMIMKFYLLLLKMKIY